MHLRIGLGVLMAWLMAIIPALAQAPNVDDFLAPAQGGSKEIKAPDKVKIDNNKVTADSGQDAFNAAAKENEKNIKPDADGEFSTKFAQFPSGLGFLATGVATYREMENPVATRVAKRKAYVYAFLSAKKGLAETLSQPQVEGRDKFRSTLDSVIDPKQNITNSTEQGKESVQVTVQMILRGFVIYEVKDDPKQRHVTVSIVSTPKTCGKLARPAPNVVEAGTLREGLNQILQEVRAGVVPPIGGRIISMKGTGETAFVGFGSAVVVTNTNDALQAKLNLSAQKIAALRSKDALCGLILGDDLYWQGGAGEGQKDAIAEFEQLAKDDPLAKNYPDGARKLEQAKQTFMARIKEDEVYSSARKGVLPPGIMGRTWFDDDHAWAFSMSVYVPSFTKAASEFSKMMKDARIVQDGQGGDKPETSGFLDEKNTGVKRPGTTVKPGPTGKVGKDDDK